MPIGPMEAVVIVVLAVLIFGPKKIPEIANALGRSIQEFRKGSRELQDSVRRELTAGEEPRVADGSADVAPKP